MYAKFFGLNQDPFSIAPDPRYLFMSERHREALAHLLYGVGGGGGFVLLSGEIGTGKTTVCRCFLEQIPANCHVAYIFNPKLSVTELLRSICDEFHVSLPEGASTARDFIEPLNQFLLRGHAAGQNNVLIIDEAQNLSADVLEQLRLLTNLETNERKLLQIVLIGQPELRRMLARPELEQLAQRVIARFHLDALSAEETGHYIAHRLSVAGLGTALPFNSKAVSRIHKLARGVPRRINLLCGRAMLGAYSAGQAQVDTKTVDKAAAEVFGPDLKPETGLQQTRPPSGIFRQWPAATIAVVGLTGLLAGATLFAAALWALDKRGNPSLLARADASSRASPVTTAAPAVSTLPSSQTTPLAALSAMTTTLEAGSRPDTASTRLATAAQPLQTASAIADAVVNSPDNSANPNQPWKALASVWGISLGDGDACSAAAAQKVYCYASRQTPLSLVRDLDRPGIITLFSDGRRLGPALLVGLTPQAASLRIGSQSYAVSMAVLAQMWRGDFATLRRAPEGLTEKQLNGLARPPTQWLAEQLAKVPGAAPAPTALEATNPLALEVMVRDRLNAFQLTHGLNPDGQAGPLTLMQLNRYTGVQEPRLALQSR
jgi:general secretion pathway protein A